MKDRSGEDFSDVVKDLTFENGDIVPVPKKFTNSLGVYHNPKAREGFQYAAAFATKDDQDCTWVETFGVEKNGTKMILDGRWGSRFLDKYPSRTEVKDLAAKMIELNLCPD